MSDIPFATKSQTKQAILKAKREDPVLKKEIHFHGYNKDLVEPYYWHLNFAYYTGKGYVPIKIEDHHYFSENSQFGSQIRQIKGGSIRAFQENLQQLIQLIKVHMMPLLKEIKEADMYKSWIDRIVENDEIYQQGLKDGKTKDDPQIKKAVEERDEAILHIKDKWVNEVDGGRIWQLQRSQNEQGLDMVLLPQLFFGTKLDNPLHGYHGEGLSLKEQLDDFQYKIDITTDAIQNVARYQYKFYTWLPSAIRETQTTFKIKVATLKQFYTQLQMYVKYMKPLLIEIAKKTEGMEKTSMYSNFEEHNPDFWNLLDVSYSYVRILGVKTLLPERGGEGMDVLRFCPYGYFVPGRYIKWGKYKGKSGIITREENFEKDENKPPIFKYHFKLFDGNRDSADELSKKEFDLLEEVILDKTDLQRFSVMEFQFSQKRRGEVMETQQGPQQVPFCQNKVNYTGFTWNLYEVATYKESLKQDELDLLETFVGELSVIKEDLLHYVGVLEKSESPVKSSSQTKADDEKKQDKKEKETSLILAPIEGLGVLVSALLPSFKSSNSSSSSPSSEPKSSGGTKLSEDQEKEFEILKSDIAEDTWKLYSIFKKTHGYMQY